MAMQYIFRALCRRDIPLSKGAQDQYTINEGCTDCGTLAGAALSSLQEACEKCAKRLAVQPGESAGVRTELILGAATPAPMPAAPPAPSATPVAPQSTGTLSTPLATALPAVAVPAPVAPLPPTQLPPQPMPGGMPAVTMPLPGGGPVEDESTLPKVTIAPPGGNGSSSKNLLTSLIMSSAPAEDDQARVAAPPEVVAPPAATALPATTIPAPASPAQVIEALGGTPDVLTSPPEHTSPTSSPATCSAFLPEANVEPNLLTQLMSSMATGEDMVDVDAALRSIPGLEGGPSKGGISWHTIAPCAECWRKAYHKHVQGLVKKQRGRHFAFGSLYHACWEIWYRYGGQRPYDEPCDAVRLAGAPKLAAEVQRLVYTELCKYSGQEASEWDIRGVEQNAIFWMEPERINGKTVQIPITCRHDMLLAKRIGGAGTWPPGPVPHGVYIVDRKTASALTYDMTKGYGMDPQFLNNALVYMKSGEVETFGPLAGVIVCVAAKHKDPSPEKSYFRIETPIDEPAVMEFYQHEVKPFATELYRRLTAPEIRGDITQWPKKRTSCVGRYGCCEFFELCDVGGENFIEAMFAVDPSRILDVERFAEPPAGVKRAARAASATPEKQAAAEKRKSKKEETDALGKSILEAFRGAALSLPLFDSKNYLVANHTEKLVREKLIENLRGAWPVETTFPLDDGAGHRFDLTITEKAVAWVCGAHKGKMTWKNIAEAICRDWWDMARLRAGAPAQAQA